MLWELAAALFVLLEYRANNWGHIGRKDFRSTLGSELLDLAGSHSYSILSSNQPMMRFRARPSLASFGPWPHARRQLDLAVLGHGLLHPVE